MHWSSDYVGLPFAARGRDRAGLDCYGLVRLALAERFGVVLPSYAEAYACTAERREIASALAQATVVGGPWRPIAAGREREGDVLTFSVMGAPLHVALVVRPGLMLHVSAGIESRVEGYRGGAWAPRLLSIHRHRSAGEGACPSS